MPRLKMPTIRSHSGSAIITLHFDNGKTVKCYYYTDWVIVTVVGENRDYREVQADCLIERLALIAAE